MILKEVTLEKQLGCFTHIAETALHIAFTSGVTVHFVFNDCALVAAPETTYDEVADAYNASRSPHNRQL